MDDTIFAPATPAGRAGIAVIRLSGPQAGAALVALTQRPLPPPRAASRRKLFAPGGEEVIDHGLVLWFPAPASFTGEDIAEFHVHGGPAVIEAVLDGLARLGGLRPAEAGEFTRRAFDNGKLDLTEVEALADLVNAETQAQRRQAVRQLSGALGAIYQGWRARLLATHARVEAAIDFADEDLPGTLEDATRRQVAALAAEIARHLAAGGSGERLRDGLSVAIVGPPNAGKSSLLNAIVKREAAIVSATAGTTRDVIEVHLNLGGYPAVLADTAGLREALDASDPQQAIEAEGVRRALARAAQSDVKIAVFDATGRTAAPATERLLDGNALIVLNKIDLAPAARKAGALAVSAKTGQGIDELIGQLTDRAQALMSLGETPSFTRARHRAALETARAALDRAAAAPAIELLAEDVRLAAHALGRITGRVDVEDVLDAIFREFCIGK